MEANQTEAGKLAKNGFDLFREGKYAEAEACYIEALQLSKPDHWALQDYHGEFSLVLAALGKEQEAIEQLYLSLNAAVRTSEDPNALGVTIACHLLAERLIESDALEEAKELINKFLKPDRASAHLLYGSFAKLCALLGDLQTAVNMAEKAIESAPKNKEENIRTWVSQFVELPST